MNRCFNDRTNEYSWEEVGVYWALKGHIAQAKGITLIESTKIRWFSR
jgi:hypothetical protein